VGAQCDWSQPPPGEKISVIVMDDMNFLDAVYRDSNAIPETSTKRWRIFEPRTVAGQPAVVASHASERADCGVIVGTAPRDSVWVVGLTEVKNVDMCARAVAVAERVVDNLAG
jgi:uncharacterized protein DUF3558